MIQLPIFYNTDETAHLEDLGIDTKLSDCDVKQIYFINIDAVSTYEECMKEYAKIHCNGTTFISTLTVDEVVLLIKNIK